MLVPPSTPRAHPPRQLNWLPLPFSHCTPATLQISLGAEYGSQATNVYTLALSQPRPRGLPLVADVRLHQLFHSYGPWSSYSELLRGGVATLTRHA